MHLLIFPVDHNSSHFPLCITDADASTVTTFHQIPLPISAFATKLS